MKLMVYDSGVTLIMAISSLLLCLTRSAYNVTVCPAGHFLNGGICEECPVGTWNNATDQTTCKNCTQDKTTRNNRTLSQDLCGKCCIKVFYRLTAISVAFL